MRFLLTISLVVLVFLAMPCISYSACECTGGILCKQAGGICIVQGQTCVCINGDDVVLGEMDCKYVEVAHCVPFISDWGIIGLIIMLMSTGVFLMKKL